MESVEFDGTIFSILEILELVRSDGRNAYFLRTPPYPLDANESKRAGAIKRLFTALQTNKLSFSKEYLVDLSIALKEPEGVQIIEHSGTTQRYFLEKGDSMIHEEDRFYVRKKK